MLTYVLIVLALMTSRHFTWYGRNFDSDDKRERGRASIALFVGCAGLVAMVLLAIRAYAV